MSKAALWPIDVVVQAVVGLMEEAKQVYATGIPFFDVFLDYIFQVLYLKIILPIMRLIHGPTWGMKAVNYRLFTGTSTGLLSTAQGLMDTVEKAFVSNFEVRLIREGDGEETSDLNVTACIMRSTEVCNTNSTSTYGGCGLASECERLHHKSGARLLTKKQSWESLTFRFVDFVICDHKTTFNAIGGYSQLGGKNMVVSTA